MRDPDGDPNGIRSKHEWRSQLSAARSALTEQARDAANARLTALAAQLSEVEVGSTVAAYAPLGNEPGSWDLLDSLAAAGAHVLLPIVAPGAAGPLSWAAYQGRDAMKRGRFGIPEPLGLPRDPAAISEAGLIFVPALATDHHGVRLGRGAGYYDRSLLAATGLLVTLLYEDELVRGPLPANDHDVRVHAALTPERGLVRLPLGNSGG